MEDTEQQRRIEQRRTRTIWVVRVLFVLTLTLCGFWVGRAHEANRPLEFSAFALLLSLFVVALEYAARVLSEKKIVLAGIGAVAGLIFSRLVRDTFPAGMLGGEEAVRAASNLLFMYLGIVMALRNADRISLSRLRLFLHQPQQDAVLIDTSVIIDGRVHQLYENHFFDKHPIVPAFVVDELQTLADSKDAAKRHNGRKGLDNLDALREIVDFQLIEKDFPDIQGVDHKLIALAKELGATILTNDYNLAKVASVHKVQSINMILVAAALRPNVQVGDRIVVNLIKEGRSHDQAVGYLEDGTMVVVDSAAERIGQSVPIEITSLTQTTAGRLAFARIMETDSDVNAPTARVALVE